MNLRSKFQDENVHNAFLYLLSTIMNLFNKMQFSELKDKFKLSVILLPKEIEDEINMAQELNAVIRVLCHSCYCNWLNVQLLKTVAKITDNQEAEGVIETYEECIYSRKVSSIKKEYFTICFNEKDVKKIDVVINDNHKDITIKEIITYYKGVEIILDIKGMGLLKESGPGCLKITIVIPLHCVLHAFRMASWNFFKLRQFHIRVLEVESFPKVFALPHSDDKNVFAILSSNTPKCT